ncbi:MAG: cysteine synthase A [Candidatus Margulisbacteria bacterium GWF2_35_9]|nr:MAG: cysteine synthase A [Candidatus Margulisbacteria bacterium GWF2_35_9]
MMKVFNSITELIGNTPLVKINNIMKNYDVNVYAKLEMFNPMSSVKDRIGLAMIEDAQKKGLLTKDSVIIEPTSGNTGIALAYVSAVNGYKIILTMPDTMSVERRKLLKALGAELVLTPGELGMRGAIDEAERLHKMNPNSFMPQQFENLSNPDIHRRTTANEIWDDMDGEIDVFVAGVGTGGTITGVSEVLKKKNKKIYCVAVEPESSAVLSGNPSGPHKIQGIGAGFIPKIMNRDVVDEIFKVSDEDAGEIARRLAKEEGIMAGISSGAAMKAVMELAKRDEHKGKNIVVIFPDSGERYLSTWLYQD